ncbi:MAG: signal peptidase I [Pirellulaceae bacterium]
MSKSRGAGTKRSSRRPEGQPSQSQQETSRTPAPPVPNQATRETVESIAVAVILAFLFRAFVAEAFVIPTGSMAPTLMGLHKDVQCPECGYWYQAGASVESQQSQTGRRVSSDRLVVAATCPLCRYRQLLDLEGNANTASFSGDRILVSKFIYDFTPPKRWDVMVFKYPNNAQQNYIKRLIGLPGETVLIKRGDIYIKEADDEEFHIARKPDRKLRAMLQLVSDSTHISDTLTEVGWPLRWEPWAPGNADVAGLWWSEDNGHSYQTNGELSQDLWLRYHHIVPTPSDWSMIRSLQEKDDPLPAPDRYSGKLISDFYAYNAFTSISNRDRHLYSPAGDPQDLPQPVFGSRSLTPQGTLGLHWVGDLAFEGEVDVQSDSGELLLQLTRGGVAYTCRIDIASGTATLSIGEGTTPFVGGDGSTVAEPVGTTPIDGPGTYSIRYSNVDAEVRLWVDGKRIQFEGPTTYTPRPDARPVSTPENPGDLAPVGVGTRGAPLHVKHLRVFRDIYYVATTSGPPPYEYTLPYAPEYIRTILKDPSTWEDTKLFDARDTFEKKLESDQFFPLGDNSPQSSDARMWPHHFFENDLLIGKAVLIYWPHPWYRPIPYLPNVRRMRLIH